MELVILQRYIYITEQVYIYVKSITVLLCIKIFIYEFENLNKKETQKKSNTLE